jgi:hypothetical protein
MREWLHGLLREKDGEPSTKRTVYFLAVVATVLFCAWEVWKHGLSQQVTGLLQWLTGSTGTAYTVGRFAENKEQKGNQAAP